jgi:hypothetical protein
MTWTLHKPTKPGWYWFREPGLNLDKPMPAWVYEVLHNRVGEQGKIVYVQLMAQHEEQPVTKRVSDCQGEWAGPITPPAVFEERESNP